MSEYQGYHKFRRDPAEFNDKGQPVDHGSFEVFYHKKNTGPLEGDLYEQGTGWYWWACFPGCLPDGEPSGPFKTAKEAFDDAVSG